MSPFLVAARPSWAGTSSCWIPEVSFAPGQTSAGVRVRVLSDFLESEKTEQIKLGYTLSSGSAFSGTTLPQTISILDTNPGNTEGGRRPADQWQ